MITFKLQALLLIGSISSLGLLVNMIRKYKLELKYTLLWLFIMLVVLLLSVFPRIFSVISRMMGIEVPVNALFLLCITCLFMILFSLTVALSRTTMRVKQLSQQFGLLKFELEELKKAAAGRD